MSGSWSCEDIWMCEKPKLEFPAIWYMQQTAFSWNTGFVRETMIYWKRNLQQCHSLWELQWITTLQHTVCAKENDTKLQILKLILPIAALREFLLPFVYSFRFYSLPGSDSDSHPPHQCHLRLSSQLLIQEKTSDEPTLRCLLCTK